MDPPLIKRQRFLISIEFHPLVLFRKVLRVIVIETIYIIGLTLIAVAVGIIAGLKMCTASASDDLVPVHDETLAMLLLADTAEKGRETPFYEAV